MAAKREREDGTYTIHDLRWAKLQAFTAGVVFACVTLAGVVNLILSIKGILQ